MTRGRSNSRSQPNGRSPSESYSSLYGHPAATRASLVQTANDMASARSPSPTARRHREPEIREEAPSPSPHSTEATPLLRDDRPDEHRSHGHGHTQAGSMNMRAIVLHVIGDALGNVGVIATGLVIWLTSWTYKEYFDPMISLVITVIIFSSALPLGK